MKLSTQQIQRLRKASNRTIPQFSKSTVWTVRGIILLLLVLWIMGGVYLSNQIKQDEQRIEQSRIEAARRQEFQRRGAQYRQDLQNFNQGVRTRNAFDER